MPALAMGLSLPLDYFHAFHSKADNQLRLLHYPEADRQVFVKGEKGLIGAHSVSSLRPTTREKEKIVSLSTMTSHNRVSANQHLQDFGTCTILFQDSVGGLEVESPSNTGVFIPATPIEGAVVFNIGDFLMRWSNGAYVFNLGVSIIHQIIGVHRNGVPE